MKIIDLLNKIANGEEVPKKFIIKGSCFKDLYFEYNEKYNCYDLTGEKFKNGCYVFGYSELNDEIEIIEDTLEGKKIPEKLDIKIQNETTGNAYITNEYGTKCYLTKHSKIIANKLNEIIDYLNAKENKYDKK